MGVLYMINNIFIALISLLMFINIVVTFATVDILSTIDRRINKKKDISVYKEFKFCNQQNQCIPAFPPQN